MVQTQLLYLNQQELIQVNMAHFAILKAGNIVEKVIVVSNDVATTEQAGIDFLKKTFNNNHLPAIQTSYNTYGNKHNSGGTPLRGNYAGVDYQYDQVNDVFYAPQPYSSWILDKTTWLWNAPVAYPQDGNTYTWNETTKNWDLQNI
jgi:hypothetical protein